MERSAQIRTVVSPRSCRLVKQAGYFENRERYLAQSKLTKNGVVAEVPSVGYARIVNKEGTQ